MIEASEALEIVLLNEINLPDEWVELDHSVGKILAEDIVADRDFPPFDRVMMDGIAIKSSSYHEGRRLFKIEGIQMAGGQQLTLKCEECCLEVMTGAMLPRNTDVIIPYEKITVITLKDDQYAELSDYEVSAGQHIHLKGHDRKQGNLLIPKMNRISPAEIGILATVGKSQVKVKRLPVTALVATGDELVPVTSFPQPHQIRQSNVNALSAALSETGITPKIYHLIDDKKILKEKIGELLKEFEVIIFSGGVSKGKADYLPEVLGSLGVEKLFHRVRQRPGKPFWMGKSLQNVMIFAFPGNPVSTFISFYKYFKPWLHKSLGSAQGKKNYAVLTEDVFFEPPLTYYLLVKVQFSEAGLVTATPAPGKGSGDLASLTDCDGFLELPPHKSRYCKGESYPLTFYK